ncbi:Ger(x)C family spore germination protein [Candidatus Soleaferrea massiliensis]|uniref:Ger(x)C family spore germination protein n=1 Tax=Candidatus Soleaferrea massiliensis TaxID=1470354 RepID=UPI0005907AEF|nr:Ger(x)C family spore germination protein [Candidatus Soleaferrea massiliensis]
MKKIMSLMICIILTFNLTGCWSYHELNDYAVVVGVGIDKAESGNVLLTAQIAKPSALAKDSKGGGSQEKAYWNITNEAETIFSTVRSYTHESPRKLYFQHNKVLIFSREVAEEGVQKYIDFFVRDNETRIITWVLVADKDKPSDILDIERGLEKVPAINIDKLVEAQQYNAETYSMKLLPFLQRLMSKTTAPVAPLIEISGEGEEQKIVISGSAVFKKGKLVGQLNKTETRGLLWVDGEVKSGIIVVECPDGEGKVDLEIMEASSTVTPEIKDGNISIKIEIKEQSNLGSQSCAENLATSEILKLGEKNASAIRNEITASVEKAQKLNADVFGFGEAVQRKYPGQWKELESKWDDIFPNIQVEIEVDAELYGTGKIGEPAHPDEE